MYLLSDGCCRREETVPLRIGRRLLAFVFVFCAAVENEVLNEEERVEAEREEAQPAVVQDRKKEARRRSAKVDRSKAGRTERTAFQDCL